MTLNRESNAELLTLTKNLVTHLNEKTVEFLERLREIEKRKLHLQRGYPSLFAFVTEELGFSAASAMRRINAMRLIKELPEVKEQISTGVLNLTTISQTQQLFKKESFSREAKLDLLVTLENKSTRTVEQQLARLSPQVLAFERIKSVSLNQNEIKFIADDELIKKLKKLKALKSHSIENLCELLNAMADLCLERWQPKVLVEWETEVKAKAKKDAKSKSKNETEAETEIEVENMNMNMHKNKNMNKKKAEAKIEVEIGSEAEAKIDDNPKPKTRSHFEDNLKSEVILEWPLFVAAVAESKNKEPDSVKFELKEGKKSKVDEVSRDESKCAVDARYVHTGYKSIKYANYKSLQTPAPNRYISKKLKAKIYQRDGGCCQYSDSATGKKCQSQQFLQFDHIKPFALGGLTNEDNLRLLCSAHNQWQGLLTFGRNRPPRQRDHQREEIR